jgi:hypothetical protein
MSGAGGSYRINVRADIQRLDARECFTGERLGFDQQFSFDATDFVQIAEVIGKFQALASRIELEGHARFRDDS